MKRLFACTLAFCLPAAGTAFAQEQILVALHDIRPRSVQAKGFSLNGDQEVAIEAVGLHTSRRRPAAAAAWILNARTREVVWELSESNTQSYKRPFSTFEGTIKLAAGDYAVYYSFFPNYYGGDFSFSRFGDAVGHLVNELFFDRHREEWIWDDDEKIDREKIKDLGIAVRGRGQALDNKQLAELVQAVQSRALINMTGLWDEEYKKQGFALDQALELEVHATGEARYDEEYDYGWIINTKTREKVWQFDYDDSRPAGGAEKNRTVRATITLPAGNYAAFWVTDDSHSHRRWNAPPPHDPEFWGLALTVKDPAAKKFARLREYETVPAQNAFLEMTRVRNDEFLTRGFTLKKPADIRIYALGEGRDGEMFDYAWITDSQTRKKVWQMDYDKTEHAGGAAKNRLYDKTIRLEAGNYVAYYLSDDSHAYRNWNTSPPIDPEYWGLSLMTAGGVSADEIAAAYEEARDEDMIAQIVNVRDNQNRQTNFLLPRRGEMRIYALGEGRDGEMFDYGWIEDRRTGRVVWKMTYDMTEYAGGSRKNRVADDAVTLPAGEYTLHYKSDDSHSWRAWNDSPPHDAAHWGITVYRGSE